MGVLLDHADGDVTVVELRCREKKGGLLCMK